MSAETDPKRPKTTPNLAGKDYLTQDEAAAYACVSVSQFRAQAALHGIRSFRWMGKIVYRRGDIARAMEQEYARQWPPSTAAARRITSNGRRAAASTDAA